MSTVDIRFLTHGLIKAETPPGFEEMTPEQKMEWASGVLETKDDDELVRAMAHHTDIEKDGFFACHPAVSAIQTDDGDEIVHTELWQTFISGRKNDIYHAGQEADMPKSTSWLVTDDHQRVKVLGDRKFTVLETVKVDHEKYVVFVVHVDLNDYSEESISEYVAPYYKNGISEIIADCGKDADLIIAECIAETKALVDDMEEVFEGSIKEVEVFLSEYTAAN